MFIFNHMETILPFIIAAVVFGFQIYANFKKEQEKARKRNPAERPSPPPPTPRSNKPVLQKTIEQSVKPVYEAYSGVQEEVDEHKKTQIIHKRHPHAFRRLDAFELPDQSVNEHASADFDLRDAVIKAAILERPYQ